MMLTEMPIVYAGGGFPWGLLIIGGILYLLWRNGMFGGPGRRGNDWRDGGGYGAGYGPPRFPERPAPEQGGASGFRGPREYFDEWHRQAHEAAAAHPQASVASPAPPTAPVTEPSASGNGETAR